MACSQSIEERQSAIKLLEVELSAAKNSGDITKIQKKGEGLLKLYETYIEHYPNDEINAPDYLYKSGMLYAEVLGNLPKAISTFRQLSNAWPNHERSENALFLIGFTYNNYLELYDKAKEAYELYLQRYPDGDMAESVIHELKYLGKTPDEILNLNSEH